MLRRLLAASLCTVALLAGAVYPAAAQPERRLNVYNWSDYIDPYAVARFEQETGIRIRYDVFDSLETLEGKLSAGRSGYDVIVPTSEPTFARLARAGALLPLDRSKLPNWDNQDPTLLKQVASSDPGNRFGAIYLYGTVGLAIRPDRVRALAPDAPLDSLDLLMKPENAQRLARCGIAVMDSATDVLPSVLRWAGRDPNSTDAADLRAAEQALLAIRPYVRAITASSNIMDSLATGEYCVALTYSGDTIQAQARAREAGRGVELGYIQPKEGAQLWVDMLAIPADAPHPEEAHAFINFLLQPEVMAGITNHVRYPNGLPAATPLVDKAVREDPNVYPTADMVANTFTAQALPAAAERARSRSWNRFKAGR
ncbi:polyamine ABC transporter substrate-binding protein [Roseomonas marmotae]|uniref:Putrescine-binding periplasmic protein n=1 Tax=Roseomonas marmotae TaxID=2768161 RepID=A0ABS3KBM3_9PROT|nr:polyamine ABC transporter substrate-binding protein [Roseomonas marmotae]MBO1074872.1 polyamine ABC transporter substrate-binding protein [Roseomonas marmotae]QTI80625.1 polyamine ABC transporter substrate-binding protein [Roseomonas marmotae]